MSIHAFLLKFSKPLRYAIDEILYRGSGEGKKLEQLRGKYRGKPMLIVGNGPSLNKTPLDAFKHIPSIGMNKIDMIFPRVAWRPDMILCTNPLVVKQHAEQFARSEISVYLSWKSRWFARRSPSVRFFNMSTDESFSDDITKRVGAGATVTYAALQFAYFVEANPVIIVGVDHSFDKSGDHKYERREGPDNNHFDPNYFASGMMWGLPNLDDSEVVYLRSRNAFEAAGRTIVDATVGGKLQIFKKVEIEEAIAMTSQL